MVPEDDFQSNIIRASIMRYLKTDARHSVRLVISDVVTECRKKSRGERALASFVIILFIFLFF